MVPFRNTAQGRAPGDKTIYCVTLTEIKHDNYEQHKVVYSTYEAVVTNLTSFEKHVSFQYT